MRQYFNKLASLLVQFKQVRAVSVALCANLEIEDYGIQAMPDVSPPKWHLAHSSWFFEQFILLPYSNKYKVYHPDFIQLFNSYYETVGQFFPKLERGFLSRPTVAQIYQYRSHVETAIQDLCSNPPEKFAEEIQQRLKLGVEHEIQHQELLLMDIKYNFYVNPLKPIYAASLEAVDIVNICNLGWQEYPANIVEVGANANEFCFDNELPRHKYFLQGFKLASRLVTNAEYQVFMDDAAYQRSEFWLSDGWQTINKLGWQAPLYWFKQDGNWLQFTLSGIKAIDLNQPVAHLSYYEADAYARWLGKRLPTEMEWEYAASKSPLTGNFLESGLFHPQVAKTNELTQLYGDLWEWTQSPYTAYPGFKPLVGSLGEYNAKFMCNQIILRGGSCLTAQNHIRPSYRNFYHPADRWLFSGLRLAEDL